MARILIAAWPFAGHINPCLALAIELQRRGHEVAFYTGRSAERSLVGQGLALFPFTAVDEAAVHRTVFSPVSTDWTNPSRLLAVLRAWLLDTLPGQVLDLERILDRWSPDAVLSDVSLWAPGLVLAEKRGFDLGICSFALGCMIPGPEAPPWGIGLPPGRTPWHRMVNRAIGWLADRQASGLRDQTNRLRRQYGLAPLTEPVHAHLGRVALYLVPSIPELDYGRRDLPASVHYVGPLTRVSPDPADRPEWLSEASGPGPLVHVCEGTLHAQDPFLLRAAALGLSDRPCRVIMTTGPHRRPSELGLESFGANIRIEQWVPHDALLPLTDLVITTGGAGTTLSALKAGIPLILTPTEWDKFDNAQRVVEAGAGIRLAPRRCSPRNLRRAVDRVLGEATFGAQARRLAKRLIEPGGAARAAELVEQHLVRDKRSHHDDSYP
jgi:MGT family glycosyltransferase